MNSSLMDIPSGIPWEEVMQNMKYSSRFCTYYICEWHFWEGQTCKEFWNIYHVQVHNGNKTLSVYTRTFYEAFL